MPNAELSPLGRIKRCGDAAGAETAGIKAPDVVPGIGPETEASLVAHPDVRHITFTGSLSTGQAIMRAAADQLTPVTLELGGKSPQAIFVDADLDAVVTAVVASLLLTAGQVCSAGKRILVEHRRRRRPA